MASHPPNITAALLEGAKSCSLPRILSEAKPYHGTWTAHQTMIAIAAVCSILTLLFSLFNIRRHLASYTRPGEQRHIVRILFTPLIFTIFYFFSVWFYNTSAYLEPVAEFYECFALVACFLLFLAFVCPDETQRDAYFARMPLQDRRGRVKQSSCGSLRWFYRVWVFVFQILITRLACSIATWTIHAVLCPLDSALQYGGIAISVIQGVFTGMCVVAILRFYSRLSGELKPRGALSKLVCFKVAVLIQIIQAPVLDGLISAKVLKPSEYISYEDWTVGLNATLVCAEMMVFSVIFLGPFSAKQYQHSQLDVEAYGKGSQRRLGFLQALMHALIVSDVVVGVFFHKKILALFSKGLPSVGAQEQDATLLVPTSYRRVQHEEDASSVESDQDAQRQGPGRRENHW